MPIVAYSRAIGPVAIDVVISEQHEAKATITRLPVEKGVDITDHVYLEPKRVKLQAAQRPPDTRIVAAFEALLALQAKREPFDLVTGLKVYTSFMIENIEVQRDQRTANVLWFSASLSEIRIVNVQTSHVDLSTTNTEAGATTDRAQPPTTRGQIEPKPVPPSFLKQLQQ